MADDIVTRLRNWGRARSGSGDRCEQMHRDAADEIERLRAERDDLQVLLRGRTAEFLTEIERLRAAGDALAVHWEEMSWTGEPEYIAWKEARRG